MSESFVEWLVARKTPALQKFLRYFLIVLTVLIAIVAMLYASIVVFIIAIAVGVGAYFATVYTDVEFEYTYVDKEIMVDKIFHKARRKKFKTYELEKIEIMAPLKSYHLDNYKNRTCKEVDISSGIVGQPEIRYVFYYNGEEKVIFEPNAEMVKLCKNAAPRKVFTD